MEISFSVDGEWITDLARTWFWDENRPYEQCEKLLFAALKNPNENEMAKKMHARDIIEGRKKLTGVNILSLEDDNSPVHLISDKLNEYAHGHDIQELKNDMDNNMIAYIDPWSASKPVTTAKQLGIRTLHECSIYFNYNDYDIDFDDDNWSSVSMQTDHGIIEGPADNECLNGLWLAGIPELAYKACKGDLDLIYNNPDKFWDNIYELIKSHKEYELRNTLYEASMRVNNNINRTGSYQKQKENYEGARIQSIDYIEKQINDTPADAPMFKKKMLRTALSVLTTGARTNHDMLEYCLYPDDYICWEGLISPDGKFYSCGFGSHNIKAYNIMRAFPERFPGIEYNSDLPSGVNFDADTALDHIIEQGWCATRQLPYRGDYITKPEEMGSHELTLAQKNAILDACVIHGVNTKNIFD